eukprot:MONOS_2199.2-p1 / transcript=MONOS_2199.2 / gene=MONOS_2199 / organism=Monocercomonoides_exilis_PA203 / gene_product=antiviral helicase / transcript_product=antiviral helicase / location=Mono_scaffold00043:174933-178803(-) / protein_length=1070 / sequence_SO=supercontig / SO=protein_coding / is_pseudo=false
MIYKHAISLSIKEDKKVIFVSALNELAIRTFYELNENSTSSGLITESTSISPESKCLVTTSKHFLDLLFHQSCILNEIDRVIFDETNFYNNEQNNYCWEFITMLLPSTIKLLLLIHPISNTREIAEWIVLLKSQPCNIIYSNYRSAPLEHFLFPVGANGFYLALDGEDKFHAESCKTAVSFLNQLEDDIQVSDGKTELCGKSTLMCANLSKPVKYIIKRNLDPCIVFCSNCAAAGNIACMLKNENFFGTCDPDNVEKQRNIIQTAFDNAIGQMNEQDKQMPQVREMLQTLLSGVGVYYNGMLPVLKEVVYRLFQQGLLKVLVATEEVAEELGTAARSILISSLKSEEAGKEQWMTHAAYSCLCSCAGRHNIDKSGVVVSVINSSISDERIFNIINNQQIEYHSQFSMKFDELLNLYATQNVEPEEFIKDTFLNHQIENQVSQLQKDLSSLQSEHDSITIENEDEAKECCECFSLLLRLREAFLGVMMHPSYSLPFLQPGRLVRVKEGRHDFGWGVVLSLGKKKLPRLAGEQLRERARIRNADLVLMEFECMLPQCLKEKEVTEGSIGSIGSEELEEEKEEEDVDDVVYMVNVLLQSEDKQNVREKPEEEAHTADSISSSSAQSNASCTNSADEEAEGVNFELADVALTSLSALSSLRLSVPMDISSANSLSTLSNVLAATLQNFPEGIPLLDPVEDMKIRDPAFHKLTQHIISLEKQLSLRTCIHQEGMKERIMKYQHKMWLECEMARLTHESTNTPIRSEVAKIKRKMLILQKMGLVEEDHALSLKGKCACFIHSANCILVAELLSSGVFDCLSEVQLLGMLGAIVHPTLHSQSSDVKAKTEVTETVEVNEEMVAPLQKLKTVIDGIVAVCEETKNAFTDPQISDRIPVTSSVSPASSSFPLYGQQPLISASTNPSSSSASASLRSSSSSSSSSSTELSFNPSLLTSISSQVNPYSKQTEKEWEDLLLPPDKRVVNAVSMLAQKYSISKIIEKNSILECDLVQILTQIFTLLKEIMSAAKLMIDVEKSTLCGPKLQSKFEHCLMLISSAIGIASPHFQNISDDKKEELT